MTIICDFCGHEISNKKETERYLEEGICPKCGDLNDHFEKVDKCIR